MNRRNDDRTFHNTPNIQTDKREIDGVETERERER